MFSFYQDRFFRLYLKEDDKLVARVEDIPGYGLLVETITKELKNPKKKTGRLVEFNMVRFLLMASTFVGLFVIFLYFQN